MKIFSLPGKGSKPAVLTDATSLRMSQHLQAYLPALLELAERVVVVVTDAAETVFLKKVTDFNATELVGIPWESIKAVVHTADPSFLTIQLRIEKEAAESRIPVIRLEDIPGACFRTDITDSNERMGATANFYGVVNQTGKEIALAQGIAPTCLHIIGVPDWQHPDPARVATLQQLRGSWKKGIGYQEDDYLTFFSTTSQFAVDQAALKAVLEAYQIIGGVLLIGLHPKLDPARYVGQDSAQAQLMLERSAAYLGFLGQQGFKELGSETGAAVVYSLKGIPGLFTLGCGELATDFPSDILPCDLFLSGFDNSAFFNNSWGTPALNLCSPEVQAAHQVAVGTPFPMAVTSGALPRLTKHDEMVQTIIKAYHNPEHYLVSSKKLLETVPYAGAVSVRRIRELVERAL